MWPGARGLRSRRRTEVALSAESSLRSTASSLSSSGCPRRGAWEGLIPLSADAKIELKGRREDNGMAAADGKSLLPAECFVAMNRMTCAEGKGPELEEFWRSGS